MITRLQKLSTQISTIQEIPSVFFSQIENSVSFGDHLFPNWSNTVFANTALKSKFEAVYNKYKSIKTKAHRNKIINAFYHNNQIENLCNNHAASLIIELKELPKNIQSEIDTLFLYLYNVAINFHGFETYVNDKIKESIDRFIITNAIEVCPLCGLEGFLSLEGQARIALDHWLCKDLFPMSAVNFDNLIPIGHDCNQRPAKGSKNILYCNSSTKKRIKAFYPYIDNDGISVKFTFIKEPTINGMYDADWNLTINPVNITEKDIFESWDSTLNIYVRYRSYLEKNIFPMWEKDYLAFINEDNSLSNANNIDELKSNFKLWRSSFPVKKRSGSIIYRAFIDYLINYASDAYLNSLCDNFRRS